MVVDTSEWFHRLAENASAGESKDGKGAGDHDVPFVWGNPRACLTTMMQARLLIMRGLAMDARRTEQGLAGDGGPDYVQHPQSGLLLPVDPSTFWSDDE